MNTEIYNVQTSIGKFRVEKTNTHLKVGGNRFCVEIRFTNETEAELQWLITKDGKCELEDKPIRGNNTVHLLNLSFTILKSYKNIKLITLLDNRPDFTLILKLYPYGVLLINLPLNLLSNIKKK